MIADRRYPRVVSDPGSILARAEETLRPLHLAASQAWWSSSTAATEEHEEQRVAAELELSDALAKPDLFREVSAARENGAEGLAGRELELLYQDLLPNQVPEEIRHRIVELDASVDSRFSQHRATVRGRQLDDNEIRRVLRESDDPAERREAWEGSKTVGAAVADDVRQLARLRNEAARGLGYRDWFALALATMEMDETRLFQTLGECDTLTAGPFARWKAETDAALAERFGCSTDELRPWHYEDVFFQEVPVTGSVDTSEAFAGTDVVALARETFDGLGLPTAANHERSDLFPRDGKSQHAFCIDIDREGDVRVLANVEHDSYWADTMLHELGHGVFDLGLDRSLPWLLRDTHLTVTEGIAIMMGALAQESRWLRDVVGLSAGEAEALDAGLRRRAAAESLVFVRWVLVMTNFERAFYADPEADLSQIWWDLVVRHQLLTPPEGRNEPDWAAKIHVASAPVYYHTYLYGRLVAAQLRAALEREAGGLVGRASAGAFLTERVFRPGQSVRWDRLIEQATGEPLTATHLAREIELGLGD
jgi:peptidyl-dipeptidase A